MKSLIAEIEKKLPLTLERETDCRETWPKRWALLKDKVEKLTSTQQLNTEIALLCDELEESLCYKGCSVNEIIVSLRQLSSV